MFASFGSGFEASGSSRDATLDAREEGLLLKSFSLSSMDFWAMTLGGTSREAEEGGLMERIEEVALCLALRDLLLHPLVLVVQVVLLDGRTGELGGPSSTIIGDEPDLSVGGNGIFGTIELTSG